MASYLSLIKIDCQSWNFLSWLIDINNSSCSTILLMQQNLYSNWNLSLKEKKILENIIKYSVFIFEGVLLCFKYYPEIFNKNKSTLLVYTYAKMLMKQNISSKACFFGHTFSVNVKWKSLYVCLGCCWH